MKRDTELLLHLLLLQLAQMSAMHHVVSST